jgi:hypothetical protein
MRPLGLEKVFKSGKILSKIIHKASLFSNLAINSFWVAINDLIVLYKSFEILIPLA